MNIFAISGLVNGIVAVTFGILVVSKNWRDRANQIFFFMTLSLAVWAFSYWQWLLSTNYDAAILWVRILSIGSLFIPVFFYHWVILLINSKTGINKIVLWSAYLTAVVILFSAQSSLFIAGLEKKSFFAFWPNPGSVYDVYFSYVYVGLITYTLYLLLRAYPKELDQNKRGQLLYVILGAILGFGGGLTNFPLWWGVNIPPYGNFLVAAFPFLLGYSVLKYKLFNAKTITAELIAFALWTFTLIITFLAESTLLKLVYGFFSILMGIGGVILIKAVYKTENLAKELEIANKRQKDLLHIMNHDVKKPLSRDINIFASILDGSFGALPSQMKELVEEGLKLARVDIKKIVDFLNDANLKTGEVKYASIPFDLRRVIESAVQGMKKELMDANVQFKIEVESDKTYLVKGDEEKFSSHVLGNLLKNLTIYARGASAVLSLIERSGKILLSLKDSGVGITSDDMKNLFTKGGKGAKAVEINKESTGEGLYDAKMTTEAHGGKIWAESEGKDKGSTFFVELPVNSGIQNKQA